MEPNTKKIAIIDYKGSNLFSVQNACEFVGLQATISSDPKILQEADAAILPGVGAFSTAMGNLEKLDLIDPIRSFVNSGRPFMGICLGLQLMFTESTEFGQHEGLDIIKGSVLKIPTRNSHGETQKVPIIGWNRIVKNKNCCLGSGTSPLKNIESGDFMYFVHSYYVKPKQDEVIMTRSSIGEFTYCSSVYHKNIFAVQFHPEKSAQKGIEVYKNWAEIVNNYK